MDWWGQLGLKHRSPSSAHVNIRICGPIGWTNMLRISVRTLKKKTLNVRVKSTERKPHRPELGS
jgi:hypothetical protein